MTQSILLGKIKTKGVETSPCCWRLHRCCNWMLMLSRLYGVTPLAGGVAPLRCRHPAWADFSFFHHCCLSPYRRPIALLLRLRAAKLITPGSQGSFTRSTLHLISSSALQISVSPPIKALNFHVLLSFSFSVILPSLKQGKLLKHFQNTTLIHSDHEEYFRVTLHLISKTWHFARIAFCSDWLASASVLETAVKAPYCQHN